MSPGRAMSQGHAMSPGRILTPAPDDYNTQPMEIDGKTLNYCRADKLINNATSNLI